jgi:hypothetical protein
MLLSVKRFYKNIHHLIFSFDINKVYVPFLSMIPYEMIPYLNGFEMSYRNKMFTQNLYPLIFLYTCAIHLALFRTICPFSSNLFLNIHFIPMIILSLDLDTSFHTLFLLNLVSFFLYSTNSMWINISFFKKKLGSTYDTNTYWVIFWFRSDLVITHSLELPITLDKWWEDTSLRTLGM